MAITQQPQNAQADNAEDVDIRAATEAMVVVQEAPALYDVYSGTTQTYTVDLLEPACECPAFRYHDGECKHIRRVQMATGQREIPTGVRIDPTLERVRNK